MAKQKTVFVCSECGNEENKWLGRCPSCGRFNTLSEEVLASVKPDHRIIRSGGAVIHRLTDIVTSEEQRTGTGIGELDRVLSGGFVDGSLTLIGGEPGIGKSTIIMQVCRHLSESGKTVLYVSGEESVAQIKLRAKRLKVDSENLLLATETNINQVEAMVQNAKPDFLVIDSIQTMFSEDLTSAAGSVSQVRECTAAIMRMAKEKGMSSIIVGHVTKEGSIAGPRILEHMVDTVLYFEGETKVIYRILRSVKNRFGSTDEIGVFEMKEDGLAEIENPSEYMLIGRPIDVSGSCVFCSIEGSRPLLMEVQALAAHTNFGLPRRTASGADYNRMIMLIAVLEKRMGMQFGNYDVYLNLSGGMKVNEPAMDAAIIAACASSYRDRAIDPATVVFGEVGLAGELRAVGFAERRIAEAQKLGFKQFVLPEANMKGIKQREGCRVFGAANVKELLAVLFS